MDFSHLSIPELLGSFAVGTIGFYMLIHGKKTGNGRLMVIGGILMAASYFI
jgi:hypothetical protein